MKIAFLMPFLQLYGAIRTVVDLSNELVDRGHDVTIYHSNGSLCNWLEVKAKIKPNAAILDQYNDVALANLRGVIGLLHSCKAKVKLYLMADRWSEFDLSFQSMLKSDWGKLAATKWSQDWLTKKGVGSYYFPPGVNRGVFHPVEKLEESGSLKLLCSGDKRPGKGLKCITEAVRILRDKCGLDFVLNSYYGKGISQSEMAQVYGQADIFVDAQWGDSAVRNNPVLESMACGTPVVCLDHESVSDWCVNNKTAILVPAKNSVLLAEAVAKLQSDKDLMERIRVNALKKVSEFTWKRTGEMFEDIIAKEMKRQVI